MSPPIDHTKIQKDDEVTVKDGRKMTVRNAFMSTNGIMLVLKGSTSGHVDQNVLLSDLVDHKKKGS